MGRSAERLKMLIASHRARREQKKSKRMATRLAVFLSAVIALPFAYWQFELHKVTGQVDTTEELAAKCDDLAATLAKVEKSAGRHISKNSDALAYRISECDEMGIDLTTGSIDQ